MSQKPPPMFIKSKSSPSLEYGRIKETHLFSISNNDSKKRYFSAIHVHGQIKKAASIFTRLQNAFKSAKLSNKNHSEIIITTDRIRYKKEEIDLGAPPPIDDSFFFENLESLRGVEIDGFNILEGIWKTVSVAEMLILTEMENGNVPERDGILFPDSDERFRSIALTWACIRGISQILGRLKASGANINNLYLNGATPVMFAAFSGEITCLEYLVKTGADLHYVSPLYSHCALHSATAGNCPETAKILLDNGGDLNNVSSKPDMLPLLDYAIRIKSEEVAELFIKRGANATYKTSTGQTPLHVACSVQSLKCCELLLQKPEVDVNALDEINRTPLHYAIIATSSNIKIVELLLKHGALVNQIDKKGFSPLHIAALEEQAAIVEILIMNGADVSATTRKGVSALNIILPKVPESFQAFGMKMDSSIMLRHPSFKNREFEMTFDFTCLLPSDERPETSLINTFMQENLTHLLTHPLIEAFLYLKWKRINNFYLLDIFFYTLMLIFMSTYVLTAFAYGCYNSPQGNNTSTNDTSIICHYFGRGLVEFSSYIWLTFVCLMLPRNILSFITARNYKDYLWNIEHILIIIVMMSAFATSFLYEGKTYQWQKYIGAFSILCGWTNLMFMIGQLPGFGTYVAMFTHIQFEFAKLLFAYSGLIIGFTLSFCTIFDRKHPFDNLFTALIKILTMMTGELDLEGLINLSEGSKNGYILVYHPLTIFAQILFSLFAILIVVILMNLLVGIAVHDIKGLLNQASLTKLIRTTKLIVFTELAVHKINLCLSFERLLSSKTDAQIAKHILLVKPLSPLEKRLPGHILNAAYDIARKNSPILDDAHPDYNKKVSFIPKMKKVDIETTFEIWNEKLTSQLEINDEVFQVKEQLRKTRRILEEMVEYS
ncbi:transient receptor potential channel pyrexia-like [Belonocnema kinseyi]|uniref:transient receptor potential channel pyrexia-like n=1 Tax=Belonocnema kinseyi TaxID=2817044 RepID=UPI00143CD0D8|nr:transient receptor potential channel pyrexia-like [Belonocnema kinseyi]